MHYAYKPTKSGAEDGGDEERTFIDPPAPGNNGANEQHYGNPSKVTIISALDAFAVAGTLILAALALSVIYVKGIAIALGVNYQYIVFGLVLSAQAFGTSRQVLLRAAKVLFGRGNANVQDVDALYRNSMFVQKASLSVVLTLATLAALGPLLGALYKLPFFLTNSSKKISGITGFFGVNPPPEVDNLNGNGIALAVNRMTPFWQARPNNSEATAKTYGENMLVISENITAMLDTPSLCTFAEMRTRLSPNVRKTQSLILSADVNATVSKNVEISATERSDFSKLFDNVKQNCVASSFFWCAGLGGGWYAGMVLGGVQPSQFPPANLSSVNYIGIWNQRSENFSEVVQKFVFTRQFARGIWQINSSTILLTNATLGVDNPESVSQAPLTTRPLNLDLFGQLLQEYNYRWYDYAFVPSPTAFMASIVWARLATLKIEDRGNRLPWFEQVHYDKSANEPSYTLDIQDRTVSHSLWLVFIFLIHPTVTLSATLLKAWLHTVPVSDGFGLVSMLSSLSHERLTTIDGAGYSGTLRKKIPIWFEVEEGSRANHGRIVVHFARADERREAEPRLSHQVRRGQLYY
ncbi:MAG: hypothetical protein M1821_009201 [Bathelium mastoideum]|nr:MAG: hypothetical protein M1821_009201 [Bathelium mastoideum]